MFNKVVRWRRLGEVENVYIADNFSQFFHLLAKSYSNWWKFDGVLIKTKMQFFETRRR